MNKFWRAAMLLKQNNQKVVKSVLFTGLLTLLASCGSSSAIESLVQADPKLIAEEVKQSNITASEPSQDDNSSNTPGFDSTVQESAATEDDHNTLERSPDSLAQKAVEPETYKPQPKSAATNNLPDSFPPSFPIYPQAELLEIKTGADTRAGTISWNSSDNRKAIADYYQAQLTTNDWEIIKPFAIDPQQKLARAIAVKDEQRVAITLQPLPDNQAKGGTRLSVVYQPLSADIANSGIPEAIDPDTEAIQTDIEPEIAQQPTSDEQRSLNKTNSTPALDTKERVDIPQNNNELLTSTADFTDLDNAPEQLNQPIATVASLGILTPYTEKGNIEVRKFAPNAIITKGEYARWLIAANNRYYQDDPGKKIYIPNDADQPAFQDVKQSHPDFGAIQGLAEAGLIPSRLTEDSTNLLFKPSAPLTREDLVTWKVPLDMRQALPKASIEAIEESWGFQDATDIDSSAVRALYADFQNGDRSNIRRVFGFTTLFQPRKPVTRAEAAASLWYFGFQGDGVTAQEVWDLETETEEL